MATKYYEIEVQIKETGKGQAEIIAPEFLQDQEWHYVQVHEGKQKAIVQVEGDEAEHEAIAANKGSRSLTDKQFNSVKKSYPMPRVKQRYRPQNVQAEAGAKQNERVIETVQQVRWNFYVIDVPVQS